MNIAMEGVRAQVGEMRPGSAAVLALVHPVHFNAGPDSAVIAWVDNHVGGAWGADRAIEVNAHGEFFPGLAAIS
jgi:hypothetical protein